jgi:uncharacterized protein YhbP (UPF0306 family)
MIAALKENSRIPNQRLLRDLLSVSTMTLATALEGDVHATPVYFVSTQELVLYYFSDEKSLHSQHIEANSQVAAAIYPPCKGWQDIKGLQIHGIVHKVETGEEWSAAWEQYRRKFPFVKSLKAIVSSNQMYSLIPTWIRFLDNSRGFGYKREWDLD